MPAISKLQQKFMGMCLSSEGRMKVRGKCPSMEVAREFARKPNKKLPEKTKKRKFST